eukprot:749004-Hanusia_phi.AAC.2
MQRDRSRFFSARVHKLHQLEGRGDRGGESDRHDAALLLSRREDVTETTRARYLPFLPPLVFLLLLPSLLLLFLLLSPYVGILVKHVKDQLSVEINEGVDANLQHLWSPPPLLLPSLIRIVKPQDRPPVLPNPPLFVVSPSLLSAAHHSLKLLHFLSPHPRRLIELEEA